MDFAFPNFKFSHNLTFSFTVLNTNVQCSALKVCGVHTVV